MVTTHINILLTDDTVCYGVSEENYVWISIDGDVNLHFSNENQLAELMGAVDQAAKLLAESKSL